MIWDPCEGATGLYVGSFDHGSYGSPHRLRGSFKGKYNDHTGSPVKRSEFEGSLQGAWGCSTAGKPNMGIQNSLQGDPMRNEPSSRPK